jgi:hypothetical protein
MEVTVIMQLRTLQHERSDTTTSDITTDTSRQFDLVNQVSVYHRIYVWYDMLNTVVCNKV